MNTRPVPKYIAFAHQLFDFDSEETPGERLFFKFFELFAIVSAAHIVWTYGLYTHRISHVVLPLGLANYIDISFMFGPAASVNASLFTVLVTLGFFRVSRYAYFLAFISMHFQYVARFSLGEISHSSNVPGMAIFAFGVAFLLFADPFVRRRFTMGFVFFFLGLGYFLAAMCKLVGTGLTWVDGRHMWLWIHEKAVDVFADSGILSYNIVQDLLLSSHFLATASLIGALIMELAACLIWFRRFRPYALIGVILLHIGIYVIMNIMFWHTFLQVIVLTLPLTLWFNRMLEKQGDGSLLRSADRFSVRYA